MSGLRDIDMIERLFELRGVVIDVIHRDYHPSGGRETCWRAIIRYGHLQDMLRLILAVQLAARRADETFGEKEEK